MDNDNVIQALPPDRSDHPLGVGILPGRVRSAQHFRDAKPGGYRHLWFGDLFDLRSGHLAAQNLAQGLQRG